MSITKSVAEAEKKIRASFAIADAQAAAAAAGYQPLRTKAGSPAARIASAVAALTQNPKHDHAAITRQLDASIDEALSGVNSVIESSADLLAAVKYLRGESATLDCNDPAIMAAAYSLRQAHMAGLADATVTAKAIERRLSDVAAEVRRLESKFFPMTRSAARVASASYMARMAAAAGLENVEHFQRRLERVKAVHRWHWSDSAKTKTRKAATK